MRNIEISINPLAEYYLASESRKKRIIQEQQDPDPVRVPYYQLARSRITKSILKGFDIDVIDEAINELKNRKPEEGNWRYYDKENSLKALNYFKNMVLPSQLIDYKLEKVKTKNKYYNIYGVDIKVSPNLIFRIKENGIYKIGAVKLHVSKTKPFNNKQSGLVAQLLYQFLSNFVVGEDEVVDPNLCLCIDPFSKSTISASGKTKFDLKEIKGICAEIPKLWDDEMGNKDVA